MQIRTALFIGILVAGDAVAQQKPPPLPDDAELRPGLLATYNSQDDSGIGPSFERIDLKPAFTCTNSTPDPRLRPGRFWITWSGVFFLREAEPVRFGAFVSGEVTVTIDGERVLKGRGEGLTNWVSGSDTFRREPGLYRIRIEYSSGELKRVPARLQLWWEGKSFAKEPLPAWRFKHVATEARNSSLNDSWNRGRDLVGQLGCARCHSKTFPAVDDPPPGPSLAGAGQRLKRAWLMQWLANPSKMRADARMPLLFPENRQGFVERSLVADYLLNRSTQAPRTREQHGDHRAGTQAFIGLGCFACHTDPEKPEAAAGDPERFPFDGLADRFSLADLVSHITDPAIRYPDGRMPKLPVSENSARDIAAYLLLWAKPAPLSLSNEPAITPEEIEEVARRLRIRDKQAVGEALVRDKGCARCHAGLENAAAVADVPVRRQSGCVWGVTTLPRFVLDARAREALDYYVGIDPEGDRSLKLLPRAQTYGDSDFNRRQRLLRHFKCHRCHQRDEERSAPIEEIGQTLWTPFLYRLPFQRTPRLTQAMAKFTREYLLKTIRDGVTGLRPEWYSYRMPGFGKHAEEIVVGLAEGDGDICDASRQHAEPQTSQPRFSETSLTDPNLIAQGPELVGFAGYSCTSCHVWNGKTLSEVEPGTVGPELTTVTARIRRDWFNRFLDDPWRIYPGSRMPAIPKEVPLVPAGKRATDPHRQKQILWAYFAQGKQATSPKPRPPFPIAAPKDGEPPLVAQIPITLPEGKLIESITVLYSTHDAIVYDVEQGRLHSVYTGAQILRQSNTWRSFALTGKPVPTDWSKDALPSPGDTPFRFSSYAPSTTGVGILKVSKPVQNLPVTCYEELALLPRGSARLLNRHQRLVTGGLVSRRDAKTYVLPPSEDPAPSHTLRVPGSLLEADRDLVGPLARPGYKAIAYPRPKTDSGEDLLMPSALAVNPGDGGREPRTQNPPATRHLSPATHSTELYIASLKTGDVFRLRDRDDDGKQVTYERFTHGLWQDVFGLLHDGTRLFILHRRNLTSLDLGADGQLNTAARVALLPHAIGNAYDWAYGLVRDKQDQFLFTLAPHANAHQSGAGSLVRITQLQTDEPKFEEISFGFRNPLGWCAGPDREIFFTDNQGEWVATNKLCHIEEGMFYGYPNPARAEHTKKPIQKPAVWVPYDWARSINGVTYDASGGRFGPFAGQFFMAELMHGGAIIRANVEKVNGVYQGACFSFWGKGLLGPLVLTFDPRGRLWVGAITEPAWMGQPDRGALFRIDYTGETPFEIQSIHLLPKGFRLLFTKPVDPKSAGDRASYQVEHYRYEYTGAYGSPELDRARAGIEQVTPGADRRSVDITLSSIIKDRCYSVSAAKVKSTDGATLVHPTGVYTVNEVPRSK
jgi:hypothetical protein